MSPEISDAIHEKALAAVATSNTTANGFIETSVSWHFGVVAHGQERTRARVVNCCERLSKVLPGKHAGENALDQLDGLIARPRNLQGLSEKKRGVFYHRSKAFLHFNEDAAGFLVDLRPGDKFVRHRVQTVKGRARLLAMARQEMVRKAVVSLTAMTGTTVTN